MSSSPSSPTIEANQLSLPNRNFVAPTNNLSPKTTASFLYDPASNSLALLHSNSSISLYPLSSLSLLSLPSLPPPQTHLPGPISSAAFLHLRTKHHPSPTTLFLTSSPILSTSTTLLRFYTLDPSKNAFCKTRVRITHHKDLDFDESKFGVVFKVSHGVSVKLVGSVNVFVMYSMSNSRIWVFGVRSVGEYNEVKLTKCGVIDCCIPVFSMCAEFGHLILGEENGVRVFPLRPLVKGRVIKEEKRMIRKNGIAQNGLGGKVLGKDGDLSNDRVDEKSGKHSHSVKLRSVKMRQDSAEGGVYFVAFGTDESKNSPSLKMPGKSTKAISISSLSSKEFLVLDSVGKLHLLCIFSSGPASEISHKMKQLNQIMGVKKLAVLPETQTVWISDGHHTVHMMLFPNMDSSVSETDGKDCDGITVQGSVRGAIFASEKIQEIVPLNPNAMLILGQGNIFAYSIS